ncbi:MAG: DinB family protein [Planctomycetota bacterium]
MRDHCMIRPTSTGCHTLWILGHLAYIEGLVIYEFMLNEVNPVDHWKDMFDGPTVSDDPLDFVPFDEALESCRARRASTIEQLRAIGESDLDQVSKNVPSAAIEWFGTYRQCFQYVSDHWFMHRGQLADARSAAGVAKMWY